MNSFSTRINKILNQKVVRSLFLTLAAVSAVVAQNNLPPSSTTLTQDNPLPVPVWKSILLLDGQLIPFRASILLFLTAMSMTIVAFLGKPLKQFPWENLKFAKTQTKNHKQNKFYNFNFNLGDRQNVIEINLFGRPRQWRRNLISIGLLICSLIFSIVTFFLFRTYTETNLGLAFWMVSLLILMASHSIRCFYDSKPGPHRLKDYLWAGLALIYALLTLWLLSIGNPWGMIAWLFSIASLYSWKYKRNKKPQSNPSPNTIPKPLKEKNELPELKLPQQASKLKTRKIKALVPKSLKQKFLDIVVVISKPKEIIIIILLLVVGGYFRFANIFQLAPGLNNDVALLAGVATQILQGKVAYSPFSNVGWGFETLFLYYIAFWMKIVGPNYLAPRFASASTGFITLIVLYFLAKRVVGKRVASISTALLGASGFHIIMSDLGSRLILQPLFEALSFLLLWLALEKRKYWLFILTGISLGFTIQAYNASVFYPVLFALFFIYLFILKRKNGRSFLSKYLPGIIVIVLAFFITAAPLAGYVSSNWDNYRARSNSLLVVYRMRESENAHPGTYWSPLVRNLVVGSLIFNQRGNSNDLYIEESALDFPITILFVIALAFTLRFWKEPLPFFLLAWFFLGLSAGYISEPNANRSIGSFIPIYLMCGIFLAAFINHMKERFKKGGFMFASVVTVIIIIVTIAFTYRDYVGPHYKYRWGYAERATGIGVYVNQLRNQNRPIYITDAYFVTDTVRMLSYRLGEDYNEIPYTRLSMYDVLATGFPDPSDVAVVLGEWPEEELTKDVLLKLYPRSKLEIIPKIDTHWDFESNVGYGITIYQNDIQNPSALQNGLLSQYYRGWDGQGEPFQKFVDPFIILPVLPDPEKLGQFSTIWTGTFVVETAGEYGFQLRSNNRSQLYIDDNSVVAISNFNKDDPERDQLTDGSIELTQGLHRIKIVYNYEDGNIRLGVLWKIPGADFNWLPVRNFTP